MSWIGSSPVANNFKRWSVEQLKGACSCYYFMQSSTKPYFSLLVHSTILISCYLQFQAYIFFHSINFSATILCLTLFCSDYKYLMLALFCNVGMLALFCQDCKYLTLDLFCNVGSVMFGMQDSSSISMKLSPLNFLEMLETFLSVNSFSVINVSLIISNLIHSFLFISHLNFIANHH